MHRLHFPIIADEHIHDEVVYFLRSQRLQVESIKERNLRGVTDDQIILLAQEERKVILTHDADFGRIMHLTTSARTGIILYALVI
jgi:predicted nuclease of predicted toxin-antitoxin system